MKLRLVISVVLAAIMVVTIPLGVVARDPGEYVRVLVDGIPAMIRYERLPEPGSPYYHRIQILPDEYSPIINQFPANQPQQSGGFNRPEDITGYRRNIFQGRWIYIPENQTVRENPGIWNQLNSGPPGVGSSPGSPLFHRTDNINIWLNGERLNFRTIRPYRIENPNGRYTELGWSRTLHVVPFYEFFGLFEASNYIVFVSHSFVGCGPSEVSSIGVTFRGFSYFISAKKQQNYFNVVITSILTQCLNLTLPSFVRDVERVRIFNETVRDPFFLDSNLFNVSRLTMGYNFLGLPNPYGIAVDGRRDFTVPLEAFQSLFLLFPIDISVVGNDVFLEIDSSYLRSTPATVPRIEPRTIERPRTSIPIPFNTFNTFSDFYNSIR